MKCPACGFNGGKNYNYSKEIIRILATKPERTIKYIKKLVSEVQQNVPSEYNSKSYFYFLKGIDKADNRIVERAIEHYLRSGYHLQGKGFAYIRLWSITKSSILERNYRMSTNVLEEHPR